MFRFALLFALFAFAAVSATEIKFDDGGENIVTLTSFGEGEETISVLYRGSDEDLPTVTSDSRVISAGTAEKTTSSMGGYTNYTIPLTFTGVGSGEYTVSIGDVSVTGRFVAAGFVILQDGNIVSGDDGEVQVGVAPDRSTYTYEVKAVGPDGSSVDISGTTITSDSSMKEANLDKSSISSEEFKLVLNDYRAGSGNFKLMFDTDAIMVNGESFETVLNVKQNIDPIPPCVAMGGAITTTDDGYVKVKMFNLLVPPRDTAVALVEIDIDGEVTSWDTGKSDLVNPDQTVAFRTPAAGKATLTCDGEPAVIIGDDIMVSGASAPAQNPADGLIAGAPEPGSMGLLTAVIEIFSYEPETLPEEKAQAWVDKVCEVTGGSDCRLTKLSRGSAILDIAGLVERDNAEESEAALVECFESCTCQTDLGYGCEEAVLKDRSVNNLAGAQVATASGLATWTIVLIAVVGAFALILVIVLGLWAVYRRSTDQSESDYSSSGPLGVPDPSDLLYEQSIVRDIYGRGDFPEGGPSQAVAEQRAREAEMREEFPRPPSSSGLSRGAGTDDASSTYSV